jgi:putative endonuclease
MTWMHNPPIDESPCGRLHSKVCGMPCGFEAIRAPPRMVPPLGCVWMSEARQRLGRSAEALAAARLTRSGMRVIARNVRTSEVRGEIDLIALDGRELVFVEVKALRADASGGPERPALAVGVRKRRKLRALALAWLRDRDGEIPHRAGIRFDVIGLRLDPSDRVVEWEHIRAAF